MTNDPHAIGHGTRIFAHAPVSGRWTPLRTADDVLALLEAGADDAVGVVDDAGATFLAPVLHEIAAIVCTEGSPRSHVAIVSRDFGVPCLMGATIERWPEPGATVEVDCSQEKGEIRLAAAQR